MRAMIIAAGCMAVAACGGAETSQANNTQANISNDARPAATANASAIVPSSTAPLPGDHAKPIIRNDASKPSNGHKA